MAATPPAHLPSQPPTQEEPHSPQRQAPTMSPERQPRWTPEELVATVAIALMAIITAANVVLRYVSDVSIAWTEEVSTFLMLLMVFAGAAAVAARDNHIRIELLYQMKSPAGRVVLGRLSRWLGALAFVLVGVLLLRTAWNEFSFGERFSSLDVPRWLITSPLAVLCIVAALRALKSRAANQSTDS